MNELNIAVPYSTSLLLSSHAVAERCDSQRVHLSGPIRGWSSTDAGDRHVEQRPLRPRAHVEQYIEQRSPGPAEHVELCGTHGCAVECIYGGSECNECSSSSCVVIRDTSCHHRCSSSWRRRRRIRRFLLDHRLFRPISTHGRRRISRRWRLSGLSADGAVYGHGLPHRASTTGVKCGAGKRSETPSLGVACGAGKRSE